MSECVPQLSCTLVPTSVGSTQIACLSFRELVYPFPVVDAAVLHLPVERDTVEPHIGAGRLRKWAVVAVSFGN